MKASKQVIDLVKDYEKCRTTAYPDAKGEPTIGYGHTGPDVRLGQTCTEEQAARWFMEDLASAEQTVNRYVRVALSQNEFDALVMFVYNVGAGAFKRSDLLRKLNVEDFNGAAGEFKEWVFVTKDGKKERCNGLVKRRAAEAALFGKVDT